MVRQLLVYATLLAAPAALAAPDAAPIPGVSRRAQADALLRSGVALRREGREREALARFREAYALDPSPRALGQMGLAAKSQRLWVEAEHYLEQCLASEDDPWVALNRDALTAAIALVKRNLASLQVESATPGAVLVIDGRRDAKLPLAQPLRVAAGALQIEVRATGFATSRRTETLAAGKLTRIRIDLEQNRSADAPSPGAPIRQTSSASMTAVWIAGGVALAGIGVGTYFGLQTHSLKDERDAVCPEATCATRRGVELDEQARRAAAFSTIGFAVGAASAASAVVFFVVAKTSPDRVALAIGDRRAEVRWTF
jgi:hypothetical protein